MSGICLSLCLIANYCYYYYFNLDYFNNFYIHPTLPFLLPFGCLDAKLTLSLFHSFLLLLMSLLLQQWLLLLMFNTLVSSINFMMMIIDNDDDD